MSDESDDRAAHWIPAGIRRERFEAAFRSIFFAFFGVCWMWVSLDRAGLFAGSLQGMGWVVWVMAIGGPVVSIGVCLWAVITALFRNAPSYSSDGRYRFRAQVSLPPHRDRLGHILLLNGVITVVGVLAYILLLQGRGMDGTTISRGAVFYLFGMGTFTGASLQS
jgi:hypothetical protein